MNKNFIYKQCECLY